MKGGILKSNVFLQAAASQRRTTEEHGSSSFSIIRSENACSGQSTNHGGSEAVALIDCDFVEQTESPAPSHQSSPGESCKDDIHATEGGSESESIPTSPSAIKSLGEKQNKEIFQAPTTEILEEDLSRQSCEENDAQVDQVLEEPDLSVQMNQDPISFIGKELTSNERHQIITQGANQPRQNEMINKEFPKSMLGSRNRSFNESWYSLKIGKEHFERKWLSYSPTKDAVFCHFCILFGNKNKETTFTQTGLRDWKKPKKNLLSMKKVKVMLKQQ